MNKQFQKGGDRLKEDSCYIVLARRHGDTWYVAAVNAGSEPLKLKFDLDMFAGKQTGETSFRLFGARAKF